MKKTLTFLMLLIIAAYVDAQTLTRRFVTPLEEKLTGIEATWVSMDADTLLDFVITGVSADGQLKIVPYQNLNTTSYFVRKTTQLTGMKSGNMQVHDWNKDNKMDLVISGRTLINTDAMFWFLGGGNYTFQKQSQKLLDYSGKFVIADLDNDAKSDILTYTDTLFNGITPADVAVFANDIYLSGRDQQGKAVTSLFIGPKFKRKNASAAVNGPLSLADMNDDGLFDAIVGNTLYINKGDTLVATTTLHLPAHSSIFTGDMTSDGKVDIMPDSTGIILQRAGDQDRDGDLDLIQLIDSIGSQWLKFYENTSVAINKRPKPAGTSFAVSTFDKTFIIWEPATDDHTIPISLTYDVWLGTNQSNIIMPSFDLTTHRRSVVRHGNAGTATSMVIRDLPDNRYFYSIQAVDNAYNGSYENGTGSVAQCFDLTHEDVQACIGTQVKLPGGGNSVWYSMRNGVLGKVDTLKFIASANDTIFSFIPPVLDCSKNKVYVVHVNEAPPSEKQTIYACKGKTIKLAIAEGWKDISWNTNPSIKNVASIDYVVNGPATITVTATSQGCNYKKEFIIKISEPSVTIHGDGFQVLKGNSVQLEATGNVETWQWDPPQGLSDSTIPNPVATPSSSTEYILTGTDSVGCTATAKTHVMVQENAFVPNLFTPNGDGKNDNLMIYGLTSPTRFNFRIFNREGSLVYETKDISQASGTGWNGFVQGTRQPSGLYYWRIDGEMPNGDKLLLNGKTTGSILLVH